MSFKRTKIQAPTSREAPNFNHQPTPRRRLKLEALNFSGAWMLLLGTFSVVHK
jgi:hypothetical protein